MEQVNWPPSSRTDMDRLAAVYVSCALCLLVGCYSSQAFDPSQFTTEGVQDSNAVDSDGPHPSAQETGTIPTAPDPNSASNPNSPANPNSTSTNPNTASAPKV